MTSHGPRRRPAVVGLGDIADARRAFEAVRRLAPAWVTLTAASIRLGKPEHQQRVTTFWRIAAGVEDPGAAQAVR